MGDEAEDARDDEVLVFTDVLKRIMEAEKLGRHQAFCEAAKILEEAFRSDDKIKACGLRIALNALHRRLE